jgi:hypothetical protein
VDPRAEYAQRIDRLLSAGCALFPNAEPTTSAASLTAAAANPTPDGHSGLAAATQQAGDRYHDIAERIAELTLSLDEAVKFAAAQAIKAGLQAKTIRDGAQTQVDAITGATNTSDGLGELVSSMDERLAAMQNHIAISREQLRAAAAQIRQLTVELSAAAAARP